MLIVNLSPRFRRGERFLLSLTEAPKIPICLRLCIEFRRKATGPPLTKGDLGGMSMLVSQKRSRKNRLFFCDSGGIRSAGGSPSSRGYLVAEAESRAIDIISSPQPRIKKLPPVTGMQPTDRFIGRSICGRTRELAHDGLATKKTTEQSLCRCRLQS